MITTALQYSGGKDSRAILHMYREQLDDIYVVWANPGAPYPGLEEEMARLADSVPHFRIAKGDQAAQIAQNGYPSDVVPINYTPMGRAYVKKAEQFKVQSAFDCCSANLWMPIRNTMKFLGVTKIIRGQRRDEQYTNTGVTNGAVIDGVEYVLPLENWTAEQVFEYLRKNNVEIPTYYQQESTSHDCWNCTGYLDAYETRIKNLTPEMQKEVGRRLVHINAALEAETAPLKKLLRAS